MLNVGQETLRPGLPDMRDGAPRPGHSQPQDIYIV